MIMHVVIYINNLKTTAISPRPSQQIFNEEYQCYSARFFIFAAHTICGIKDRQFKMSDLSQVIV